MRARLLIAGTAAALTAAVLALGGAFAPEARRAPDRLPAGVAESSSAASPPATPRRDRRAAGASFALRPRDAKALETLGLAYLQRVRETGDASYYPKADGVLHERSRSQPHDLIATAGLGQLALVAPPVSRGAHARPPRAVDLADDGGVYGVIGDAELELGRYPQAFARVRPHGGAQAERRVVRARLVRARAARRLAGAARAMQLASSSAVGEHEAYAWTHVQLGLLYLSTRPRRCAARELRVALALFPGYPFALDALAQAEAALGHLRAAIALERAGRRPRAAATVRRAARRPLRARPATRSAARSAVRADRRDPAAARRERCPQRPRHRALRRRPRLTTRRTRSSSRATGYASGRASSATTCSAGRSRATAAAREALPYSKRALRLGTQDALKFFHRGFDRGAASATARRRGYYRRALALNPHFSILWAPVARKGARS